MREMVKRTGIILLGIVIIGLAGCGGVEPEKRDYPLTLAFGCENESIYVIYGMANLDEVTEQGKSDEDTPGALKVEGASMKDIHENYAKTQQYYLDLGHVQAVVFDKSMLLNRDVYGKIVGELQRTPEMGKNAYVFQTSKSDEVMKIGLQKEDSLGEYLRGMYENHMRTDESGRTLEDLYYDWNNFEKITELPVLEAREGQVFLCENQ